MMQAGIFRLHIKMKRVFQNEMVIFCFSCQMPLKNNGARYKKRTTHQGMHFDISFLIRQDFLQSLSTNSGSRIINHCFLIMAGRFYSWPFFLRWGWPFQNSRQLKSRSFS
jgi:hypothetical protein